MNGFVNHFKWAKIVPASVTNGMVFYAFYVPVHHFKLPADSWEMAGQ
jgi:hypothetical protein